MRTIYIRGGDKEEPGVDVMRHHLENAGHKVVRAKDKAYDVVLCWGVSMRDPLVRRVPSLNGNVNLFNKFEALRRFEKANVPTPVTVASYELMDDIAHPNKGPWFGREFHHERGRDIEVYKTHNDVVRNGAKDFYTLYFPHTQELRVWTYGDEAFAVYHKQYRNPGIDNYKNMEFRSENRDDLLRNDRLVSIAVKATKALKMDFGAVDILYNEDRPFVLKDDFAVLEVNSMPDISSYERLSGIRLAKRVSQWAERA